MLNRIIPDIVFRLSLNRNQHFAFRNHQHFSAKQRISVGIGNHQNLLMKAKLRTVQLI